MKANQQELMDWAISRIQQHFKDDIALLVAMPESPLEDNCHGECFDYFVPASERGNGLAQTFILNGVGHDLYPRSWERIENMARLDDHFTRGLADARILYSRSEEDVHRFTTIQAQLQANLRDKDFMFRKALEKIDTAMDFYRTAMFEDSLYKVRMAAGYIAHYLSLAVAYLNGTYFRKWFEPATVELARMKELPDGFIACYHSIVRAKSLEELQRLSHEMIRITRGFADARKPLRAEPVKTPVYEDLASWYEELSTTWRRIYRNCDEENTDLVFEDAVFLQGELNVIREDFNLREIDLLGCFDATDLTPIKNRAHELEQYVVGEIEAHGVTIDRYDTLEAFLAKNG